MATFNYYSGIRQDFSAMLDEIGETCTVSVPTRTMDAWGNLTTVSYATYTEVIWCRPLTEVMSVEPVGQLNREDLRFVAKYDTHIVPEARITIADGSVFTVIALDTPNESGYTTTIVGYAKRVLN